MSRVMAIEPGLHNNRPDIHADIENDNDVKAELGTAALAEAFHIEDEAQAKASNTELGQRVQMLEKRLTYMQKKGEIREERARARTEK